MKRIDKVDMDKFAKLLNELLNKKDIRCNDCGKLITFTTKEEAEKEEAKKPFVFGNLMLCNECEFYDDITQAHITYKKGYISNLADYFSEIGLFNEIKSWDSALELLDTIDFELADRKRIEIKKEDEIEIEEIRSKELAKALNCSVQKNDNDMWEVSGAFVLNKKEEAIVGFQIAFPEDENRVAMLFFIENIGIDGDQNHVIDKFRELLMKDYNIREIESKYECLFGFCEDDSDIGVFCIQYIYDDFSEREISRIIKSVLESARVNIYNINSETSNQDRCNFTKENISNFIHMKKLANLFEFYCGTIEDLYTEEDDFDAENEWYELYKNKTLNIDTELELSNTELSNNEILVSLEHTDDFTYDWHENRHLRITPVSNDGILQYEINLYIPNEYKDIDKTYIGTTNDIYKILICVLNLKDAYSNEKEINNEDIFTLTYHEPVLQYIKYSQAKYNKQNNHIIKLISALEAHNSINESDKVSYCIKEYLGGTITNHFTITTKWGEYEGQISLENTGRYRVREAGSMVEHIENQTLEELLDFVLKGKDKEITDYVQMANNNPIIDLSPEDDEYLELENFKEYVRIYNVIEKMDNFYSTGNLNSYNEDDFMYNRVFSDSTVRIHFNNIHKKKFLQCEIIFEKDNSRYIVKINNIKNVNGDFIYDVNVIEKGKVIKNIETNGLLNLISTIGSIREYGIEVIDTPHKIQWREDFSFDELKQVSQLNFNQASIFDLFVYITESIKNNNYPIEMTLDIALSTWDDDTKLEVTDKNNRKYTIDHYTESMNRSNNVESIHNYKVTSNSGLRFTRSNKIYTASTKREVLDIILCRNLKGDVREDKFKEMYTMCNIYFNALSQRLDLLSCIVDEYKPNEDFINNLKDKRDEMQFLCECAANIISGIITNTALLYDVRLYDTETELEKIKMELSDLKNDRDRLNIEQDTLKPFKSREDIRDFAKFISQISKTCSDFNLYRL